jgi:phosphohistidine phosphatase
MQLYILRHGIAYESSEWAGNDATRPLTTEGMEKTRDVIRALKEQKKLAAGAIWSSPLVRALQTAHIAADVLGLEVTVFEAMASGTSLGRVVAEVAGKKLPEKLILVGHEPDCGFMIAELLGDPGGDYALKKAGIACLKGKFEAGGMKLEYKLAPRDVL